MAFDEDDSLKFTYSKMMMGLQTNLENGTQ